MGNAATMNKQGGTILLEALIAILIFSIGILSLVGLQAMAVKHTSEAKYRTDASFVANKLIAQMWADNPAAIAGDYASGGAKFQSWKGELQSPMTGLPNANATIAIAPIAAPQGNQITLTVTWRHPSEPATQVHRYVAVAQIPVNP